MCKLEKAPQKDLLKGNKPLSWWRKPLKTKIIMGIIEATLLTISIPWGLLLGVIRPFIILFHNPINTLRYVEQIIINGGVFKKTLIITIYKNDKLNLKKQFIVNKLRFAVSGIDKFGVNFSEQNCDIKRIDKNILKFKENQDSYELEIFIPFSVCKRYFNSQKLNLTIGFTDLVGEFIPQSIDLKNIVNNYTIELSEFVEHCNMINNKLNELSKTSEFRNMVKNSLENNNELNNFLKKQIEE